MSVKLLKFGKPVLVKPITNLINTIISVSTFPKGLKGAQVTPLFKKNDLMLKANYTPVRILPIHSKKLKTNMCKQLSNYFDTISYQFHCAFRKGHECHTALVVLLENGKHALDCNEYVAAISMDLSNAFEYLPHKILLS